MSWLLALFGFIALIILHEAGHFTAAKAVGMRVERFSLFFPPLIVRKKIGETEYAIGALPLGGYVKISGMNPSEELPDEVRTRAYYSQPVWKRVVVIAAGPLVNLILGLVLLVVAYGAIGPHSGTGVSSIQKGFPAQGVLHSDDVIKSVNGRHGTAADLAKLIQGDRGSRQPPQARCQGSRALTITVHRNGRDLTISRLRPRWDPSTKRMRLGFQFDLNAGPHQPESIGTAFNDATTA